MDSKDHLALLLLSLVIVLMMHLVINSKYGGRQRMHMVLQFSSVVQEQADGVTVQDCLLYCHFLLHHMFWYVSHC
jgi:hypothetical protein